MDWRAHIASNQRKTAGILCSFIFLYFMMGWLLVALLSPSVYLLSFHQLQDPYNQQLIAAFLIIACVLIMIAVLFGSRLSLSGANAKKVTQDGQDALLYNVVEEMKIAAGLRFMPTVYVLSVDYYNAFASGWNEKNAVIAISRPLLDALTREELQAVIAHEMSHIKYQDIKMLTLVMVSGNLLVNMVDILAKSLLKSRGSKTQKKEHSGLVVVVIMVLRFVLPLLTVFMFFYVSRKREFLADAGCVHMTRNSEGLRKALKKIDQLHRENIKQSKSAYQNTPNESFRSMAYIYSPEALGIRGETSSWFSTHPSLQERLQALAS